MTTSGDLATMLSDLGVDIRRSEGKEITGRCPVHIKTVGKEDRSPSWSMNAETGLWICFSCGARGTLSMLVSELTGEEDTLLLVHRMLIDSGINRLTSPKTHKPEPDVDWVSFGRFTRVPERMLDRRCLDTTAAWRLGIRWDTEAKCWIIPIVSPLGELKGWQAKKTGWFRNTPEGVIKSSTLFGIDRFRAKTAVIVESPLDVVRLASVVSDPQGLATFGSFVSTEQMRLMASVADGVIIAMDNDPAGWKANRHLQKNLPYFRDGVRWFNYKGINVKDIGEMSAREIKQGIDTASVMPPWVY